MAKKKKQPQAEELKKAQNEAMTSDKVNTSEDDVEVETKVKEAEANTETETEMTTEESEETPDGKVEEKAEPQAEIKKEADKESVLKDQLMRLQADFENYKKRTAKEKTEIYAHAVEGVMTKLLTVIDNLDRAEASADSENFEGYHNGVQMIFKEFMNVLQGEGLKEIDALDQPFDPNFHYGVTVGQDEEKDDQVVLEVLQKGYMCKDKVIRPAMVKVNNL